MQMRGAVTSRTHCATTHGLKNIGRQDSYTRKYLDLQQSDGHNTQEGTYRH